MPDSVAFQEVESNHSGRLSYVRSQPAAIPSSRPMLSHDKRPPLGTWNASGPQENVFGNQFSTFDSHHVLQDRLQGDLSQKMKIEIRAQFQCRHLQEAVDHEFIISCGYSAELCGWTAKTADIGTAI